MGLHLTLHAIQAGILVLVLLIVLLVPPLRHLVLGTAFVVLLGLALYGVYSAKKKIK